MVGEGLEENQDVWQLPQRRLLVFSEAVQGGKATMSRNMSLLLGEERSLLVKVERSLPLAKKIHRNLGAHHLQLH